MNTQTAGIGMVIALVIGGAIGYVAKPSQDTTATDKKLAEAVVMMKEQAVSIETMSKMMATDGSMMQSAGAKYKDEALMSMGKDMTALSAKYMKETTESTTGDKAMNEMMGQ